MSRRANLVLESALKLPCSPAHFLDMLRKWRAGVDHPVVDPLNEGIFEAEAPKKKSGAQNSDRAAVNCAQDFGNLVNLINVSYPDLDAWMVGWPCNQNIFLTILNRLRILILIGKTQWQFICRCAT